MEKSTDIPTPLLSTLYPQPFPNSKSERGVNVMVCSVSLFLPPPLINCRGESGVLSREMHRLSPGTDFYIK